VCKICKAKFEEKFLVLQDKNYVAMLRNISRTCEARFEAIYEHVYEEGQADVQKCGILHSIS